MRVFPDSIGYALHEFHRVGVDFMSSQENIDTPTPQGGLIFTVVASLAQFERALISERVKAGMARAKAQGKRISGFFAHITCPDSTRGSRAYCGPLSAGVSMHQMSKKLGIG